MKLTTKELIYLKKYYPEHSTLSLFANLQVELDGTEEESLTSKKILSKGNLVDSAKKIIGIMANAETVSRIVLKDTLLFIEKYLYELGDQQVIVENANGQLLFSGKERIAMVMEEFAWYFGNSNLKTTQIEEIYSEEEMLVVTAIIDLQRRELHKAYLDSKEAKVFFSLEEIVASLGNHPANSISTLLEKNYGIAIDKKTNIKNVLEGMIARGTLIYNHGYGLNDDMLTCASQLLIPRIIGSLDCLRNKDGKIVKEPETLIVSAGIRDNIAYVFTDEGVEFTTVSANELLALISIYMNLKRNEY